MVRSAYLPSRTIFPSFSNRNRPLKRKRLTTACRKKKKGGGIATNATAFPLSPSGERGRIVYTEIGATSCVRKELSNNSRERAHARAAHFISRGDSFLLFLSNFQAYFPYAFVPFERRGRVPSNRRSRLMIRLEPPSLSLSPFPVSIVRPHMIPGGRAHKHEQKKPSFHAKGGSPHNSALAARWQERKMPSIAHAAVAAPLLPLRPTPLYSPFTAFVHHSFPAFFPRSPPICMSSLFTAQRCCV